MHNSHQAAAPPDKRSLPSRGAEALRSPVLRISVIHSDTAEVERSLQELKRAQFRVKADVALSPEQFTKRLGAKSYNLILAKYPAATDWETRAVKMLRAKAERTLKEYSRG